MKAILPRSITWLEAILALLVCISVSVFLLPKHWLSYSLELDPKQYRGTITSDADMDGISKVEWINKEEQQWHCTLIDAAISPFCSLSLTTIGPSWQGLDLNKFHQMTIWGNYTGAAYYMRIYLRNRHINYYKIGDDTTTKYNMVEIPVSELKKGVTISMANFDVSDWWVSNQKILPQYSHPEFNDVIFVELQTGSDVREGEHEFQITKIKWDGLYITNEALYRIVVICWAVVILLFIFFRMIKLRIKLISVNKYHQELVSINKLLNLQNRQFEDLAKLDPLTGILNRVGIRTPLLEGIKDWREKRIPLSFALMDLDHFKKINDTLGHDVGDEVLKNTAKILSQNIRSSDFVARWGGEEFILVMPNTDIENAKQVIEKVRATLASSTVHPDTKVTGSFGVTTLKQEDLDILFKEADEALYDAKKQGRNQVCTAH